MWTRPSRNHTPSATARSAGAPFARGPSSRSRTPDHTSPAIHAISRAALARSCTSASADSNPSWAATASCSCNASRSECELVTRCNATRMSRRSSRPVSTRARSAAVSRPRSTIEAQPPGAPNAQPPQSNDCRSRRPPAPSLRSGSRRSAITPGRSRRTSAASARTGRTRPRRRAASSRALRSSSSARSPEPARNRTSRNDVERVDVVVGEGNRLLDRAGAVPGDEARVPQRVPQLLGHRANRLRRPPAAQVVHQEHVDIGAGTQFAPRVRPERHQRDVARGAEVGERLDERGIDGIRHRGPERASAQRGVGDQRGAGVAQPRRDQFRFGARARQSRLLRFGFG